jgi:hypothetical protein
LLRHAPSQFHLVLTARTEPPLPLAQLRAQNRLLEIDAAALRFDMDETSRFLEHEKLGALDPSEVRLLCAKTEGWPAVLRIIASTSSQCPNLNRISCRAYLVSCKSQANRLISNCTEAMYTQALALAIDASKSFAKRRFRLSQASVRSTTQRRGSSLKPVASAARLTISMVQFPNLARASLRLAPL